MNVNAACSGGIIAAGALGHLAAIGQQDKVGALTLMVCALDQARMGTAGAFASRELAAAAVAESARKGYIDGRALEGVFAWLRPNDLVWNYFVNNYLLGKDPPAFDILYWNQDTVRLAAGLHRDFVRIALGNALTVPGEVEVLGTPIDLGAITLDSYTIAGLNDHIVPWENAYRSAQLLGGVQAVRAVDERPHPGARQPAQRREPGELPRSPTTRGGCAEAWVQEAERQARQLVAGLPRLACAARRRAEAGAEDAGEPQAQGDGQGAGQLRTCQLTARAATRSRDRGHRRRGRGPERFVFGADPVRERWWGRPLAETRWWLELGRLLADPVWRGDRRPARRRPPGRA